MWSLKGKILILIGNWTKQWQLVAYFALILFLVTNWLWCVCLCVCLKAHTCPEVTLGLCGWQDVKTQELTNPAWHISDGLQTWRRPWQVRSRYHNASGSCQAQRTSYDWCLWVGEVRAIAEGLPRGGCGRGRGQKVQGGFTAVEEAAWGTVHVPNVLVAHCCSVSLCWHQLIHLYGIHCFIAAYFCCKNIYNYEGLWQPVLSGILSVKISRFFGNVQQLGMHAGCIFLIFYFDCWM